MSNEVCIRDPIYNYIYLTEIEASVIEHPLFQRLRFITQNGTAYYTYPSNRNDRFLHSLGCMYNGGRIFLNATENIQDKTVSKFLTWAYKYIKDVSKSLLINIDSTMREWINKNDKTLSKYGLNSYDSGGMKNLVFARTTFFQSIRLACLLHDVGHFPFSHTLENSFYRFIENCKSEDDKNEIKDEYFKLMKPIYNAKTYAPNSIALHEQIGVSIVGTVICEGPNGGFIKVCKKIASDILEFKNDMIIEKYLSGNVEGLIQSEKDYIDSNKEKVELYKFFKCLHDIVSSVIDAERLDYCKRDPFSSGIEFGAFDLERLVDNFALVEDSNGELKILVKVQALSAIESFYHQRFLMYKYLVYHHNKVRMDNIIQEITYMFLECYIYDKYKFIKELLERFNFGNLWRSWDSDKIDNYYFCNENWYFTLLQSMHMSLESHQGEYKEDKYIKKLILLIETFLFRKTDNIYSLFKRRDTYVSFDNELREKISSGTNCEPLKWFFRSPQARENLSKKLYEEENVICLTVKTDPKTVDKEKGTGVGKLKLVRNNDIIKAEDVSAYLKSLCELDANEQDGHIFLINEQIKKDENFINNTIEKVKQYIIIEYNKECNIIPI